MVALFHGAHELVSAAVKVNGFCMSEAGFLSVRGDLRNNRKPQPAKTVLPNKHSMKTLVVLFRGRKLSDSPPELRNLRESSFSRSPVDSRIQPFSSIAPPVLIA